MVNVLNTSDRMPRSAGGKRDNPNYGQLNANLLRTKIQRIRLYCTALNISISDATDEAFDLWLEANKDQLAEIVSEEKKK